MEGDIYIFFNVAPGPNAGHGFLIFEVSRSQTKTHHSQYDFSGRVIGPSQRPLPDKTHNRHAFIPTAGFEPTISAGQRPHTQVLNRAAIGIGMCVCVCVCVCIYIYIQGVPGGMCQTSGGCSVTHLLITKYILKLAGICGFCNVNICT